MLPSRQAAGGGWGGAGSDGARLCRTARVVRDIALSCAGYGGGL